MRRSQSSSSSSDRKQKNEKSAFVSHRVRRGRACDMGGVAVGARLDADADAEERDPTDIVQAAVVRRTRVARQAQRKWWELVSRVCGRQRRTNPSVFLGSTPVLLFSAAEFGVLAGSPDSERGGRGRARPGPRRDGRGDPRHCARCPTFPQAYLCLAALASAWLVFAARPEGSRPVATRTRVGVAWATCRPRRGRGGPREEPVRPRRPQLGLSSFAFPSGHTCAACVLSGVFLFLLLDPLSRRRRRRATREGPNPGPSPRKKPT